MHLNVHIQQYTTQFASFFVYVHMEFFFIFITFFSNILHFAISPSFGSCLHLYCNFPFPHSILLWYDAFSGEHDRHCYCLMRSNLISSFCMKIIFSTAQFYRMHKHFALFSRPCQLPLILALYSQRQAQTPVSYQIVSNRGVLFFFFLFLFSLYTLFARVLRKAGVGWCGAWWCRRLLLLAHTRISSR